MKRILLFIFALLIFQVSTPAQDTNLTFLYINGSNNNDKKMKDWYINGVNKLHPVMKRKFEKNWAIKKWTKDNKLVIDETPQIFFWGYDSKTDLDFVKDRLNISKAISSTLAYEIRSLLTQFMHDAIWVQKTHNMLPILDDLNEEVKKQAQSGQNVIMFGYSAGTFVNYQYMIYKFPYIDTSELFKALKADSEILEFVENNPRKSTCLSALTYEKGNLGVMSETGHFVMNQNKDLLMKNYLKLDEYTEKYCAPKGYVKGIVNFASPIPLFYSDMADENYEFTYYTGYMVKYLLENGIYFLTVNFREDPLGFPTSRNFTIAQIEDMAELKIENPTGVMYDNSSIWSRRSAFLAHTSYWSARGTFANGVVKSFVNGTKFLYDEKYQNKVLKRKSKKSEVL
ncbi:hypothetical protein IJ541_08930 [bacterium]|nr:hypothetical protein [bacterium]MBQ9246004.1 hypothetical protein [bacterium]MBQ9246893.1 hypothetical protein [bacterium]